MPIIKKCKHCGCILNNEDVLRRFCVYCDGRINSVDHASDNPNLLERVKRLEEKWNEKFHDKKPNEKRVELSELGKSNHQNYIFEDALKTICEELSINAALREEFIKKFILPFIVVNYIT